MKKPRKPIHRRSLLKSMAAGATGTILGRPLLADLAVGPSPRPGAVGASFFDVLVGRRSRRFARGLVIEDGAMPFRSAVTVSPLTADEEAWLGYCAAGVTGAARGDLDYSPDGGGQVMAGFVGRTVPSPDAACVTFPLVTNDRETYVLKRPQDLTPEELDEVVTLARDEDYAGVFRVLKHVVKRERSAPSLEPPYNAPVNRWSLYREGTTYWVPVADLTYIYINTLLCMFDEKMGIFVVDERRKFRPAGLKAFGRSRGRGQLHDRLEEGRTVTIQQTEASLERAAAVEIGAVIQNLGLGAEALDLGGFPSFAGHEWAWFEAAGFSMGRMKASKYLGLAGLKKLGARALGRDLEIPYVLGLEDADGNPVVVPYCPPHYASMRDAVEAVIERKFGARGVYGSGLDRADFRDPEGFGRHVRENLRPSRGTVEATIAYCEYLVDTYGRFPAYPPCFRTVVGFQAARLDESFYLKYYRA